MGPSMAVKIRLEVLPYFLDLKLAVYKYFKKQPLEKGFGYNMARRRILPCTSTLEAAVSCRDKNAKVQELTLLTRTVVNLNQRFGRGAKSKTIYSVARIQIVLE